jgi:hypothetical protein
MNERILIREVMVKLGFTYIGCRPYTEIGILIRGRSTVTRRADGTTQRTPASRS